MGFDWYYAFHPALVAFIRGQDPFAVQSFFYPPWLLLILAPLGLLPPFWGAVCIDLISLSGLVALCRKGGKMWMALPLAASFPMAILLWVANVDGLCLWGLAVGGPIGLLLLSVKPQVAGLVGVIWALAAWREGGWRKVAILVAPTLLAAAIFSVVYPRWPLVVLAPTERTGPSSVTGFPWFVPLGLALLVAAIRRGRKDFAAMASMILSPYARVQSWIGALVLVALAYPAEGLVAVAASWLIPLFILGLP